MLWLTNKSRWILLLELVKCGTSVSTIGFGRYRSSVNILELTTVQCFYGSVGGLRQWYIAQGCLCLVLMLRASCIPLIAKGSDEYRGYPRPLQPSSGDFVLPPRCLWYR
jgi:hypothetical protein